MLDKLRQESAASETLVEGILHGAMVSLRPAAADDIPTLAKIRATPEVYRWWRGEADMSSGGGRHRRLEAETLVVEFEGRVVGAIQWSAETEPDYRHAGIDIYLDPSVHRRGMGSDAVRTLARHLIVEQGFHRLVIDPAADNAAAIRCYTKVGFRPVGIMRKYERGSDGTWHDGLLMDLLAEELGG